VIRSGLAFVGGHGPKFIAAGVVVALFVPFLTPYFRPLMVPALMFPMTVALLRIDWSRLRAHAARPLPILLATVWILGASPVLMALALKPWALTSGISAAMVLMAAAPPIVSAAAISLMLGLDAALAVVVVVLATALTPLTLPPLALLLLGIEIDIGLGELMTRLALIIGGAFAIALVIKRFVPDRALRDFAPELDGLSVASLLVFALAIMDGINERLMAAPAFVIGVTALSYLANIALQAASAGAFLWMGRKAALTLGLLGGNCNMGLVLTALGDNADPDTALYFAMAQFPMYTLPAVTLPLYRRLLHPS